MLVRPVAAIATPNTHGPAPKRRSSAIPTTQLLLGLFRRLARAAAAYPAASAEDTTLYMEPSGEVLAVLSR